MKSLRTILSVFFCIIMFQSGCTSLQTFPVAARAGDTVSLALGSYDNMTKNNIAVEFLPDGVTPGSGTALTARAVFRLYADQTSRAYQDPTLLISGVTGNSGHAPWMNVLVVDLPSSLNTGPTPISGQVYVTRTGAPGTSPKYPGHGTDLSDFWDDPAIIDPAEDKIKIALTVLPTGGTETGTGVSGSFQYEVGGGYDSGGNLTPGSVFTGNLNYLQPVYHMIVASPFDGDPSSIYTNATYGAVEIDITVSAQSTISGSPVDLLPGTHDNVVRVIADDMESYTNSRRSFSYSLVGTNQLKVIMVSSAGKLKYFEPRVSILFTPFANLTWADYPAVTSVKYYDVNGVVTSPPAVPSSGEYTVNEWGGI